MRNLNKIQQIEKSIEKYYGKEALVTIQDTFIDESKREQYFEESNEAARRRFDARYENTEEEHEGFRVIKKSGRKPLLSSCPVCKSLNLKGSEVYLNKYECCERCFIDFVEDREDRWNSGWRPDEARIRWALNNRK